MSLDEFDKQATGGTEEEVFPLSRFAMNGLAKEMEKQMLEDKYILGRLAILGQSTVFYAKPNYGKTLIAIYELTSKIENRELNPKDIFYINADDNHKGLVYKLKLAERYGFTMVAPGHRGFKPEEIYSSLDSSVARGKIIILDTVKKFTDLMRKDKVSDFCERVRQFISRGGSAVMMAHPNKHRGEDNKIVFGGVSDLVDDSDCAYLLDIVRDDPLTGMRTVKFENIKNRGDVALQAFYKYNFLPETPYHDRLHSVSEVLETERREVEKKARLAEMLDKNFPAVNAIKDCIKDGITQKTELIKEAADRGGLSQKVVKRALTDHEGDDRDMHQFWHVSVSARNTNIYALNYGVE